MLPAHRTPTLDLRWQTGRALDAPLKNSPFSLSKGMEDRRELLSCVDGISVSDERRLLAEIRKLGELNINETTRLSNGMLAQEFAMRYVIGNRRKRLRNMQQSKEKALRRRLEALEAQTE